MMTRRHCWRLLLLIGLLIPSVLLRGQRLATVPDTLSDRAAVSLLVAAPSAQEVYTLYGHVGLRLEDVSRGIDITFNYGIFSFDDDFLYKFIKGETDYLVVATPTQSYLDEYLSRGSQISELVLDLPSRTINNIWTYLLWNIQPEHAEYRYNFFYDNCSTRPLEIIERAIAQSMSAMLDDGTKLNARLLYPSEGTLPERTWRQEINTLQAPSPWLVFGTDALLGAPTDEPMTMQERTFSPNNLRWLLEHSTIVVGDVSRPALRDVRTYTPDAIDGGLGGAVSDGIVAYLTHPSLLLGVLLLVAIVMLWRGRYVRLWHILLLVTLGVLGLLVAYVSFVSVHPHRYPNFNILVLNPLFLLGALALGLRPSGRLTYGLVVLTVLCALLLLLTAVFTLQTFNPGVYMLVVMLLIFAYSYVRHRR